MKNEANSFQFGVIARIESPFKEKFGIPRQPGLVPSAFGRIHFLPGQNFKSAIRDLERFTHLWVVFVFHDLSKEGWKASIRPPRLGGGKRVGVLSSRSPHRPNPIGLSALKIEQLSPPDSDQAWIEVSGLDLLDGTPVLDVKPYIPYTDSIPTANSGWASRAIGRLPVVWTPPARAVIDSIPLAADRHRYFKLVEEVLSLDPRPAFLSRRSKEGEHAERVAHFEYSMQLGDFDVHWTTENDTVNIQRVTSPVHSRKQPASS